MSYELGLISLFHYNIKIVRTVILKGVCKLGGNALSCGVLLKDTLPPRVM